MMGKCRIKSFFFLLVAINICYISQKVLAQEINQHPNVVIILADDLGYGDVSSYNENSGFETPNIDRLAEKGISFTNAYTSSSVCTPTRYGILTGRYNWRSELKKGVLSGYDPSLINTERLTIADMLHEQNYHTAMIGKWHLGWDWQFKEKQDEENSWPEVDFSKPIENGPLDHGFTYSYGTSKSLSAPPYIYAENSRAMSIPNDISVNYDEKAYWGKGPIGPGFKHSKVLPHLTDKSIKYINEQASTDDPFFLFFSLTAPHAPIIPTTEFIGESNTNAYGDFVIQVDDVVGQIMQLLKGKRSLKNTIVIFTSDNGQSPRADFGDDELSKAGHDGSYIFRGEKFDIYEGGLRVPFIVSWPGKIEEGISSDEIISTVDFMATFADITGYELPEDMAEDSYSFLPVLLHQHYNKPLREATVLHSSDGRFAIRKGEWKLILWPGSGGWSYPSSKEELRGLPPFQLYNLKNDPSEERNLIYLYPEKVKELKSLLEKYVRNGRSTPGVSQENDGPERWPELDWMNQ